MSVKFNEAQVGWKYVLEGETFPRRVLWVDRQHGEIGLSDFDGSLSMDAVEFETHAREEAQ